MLKKITLLFFIVVTLSCFCSCERYGTEIEDMMIIQGIAVDKDKEGYEVTIEMLNNKQSASADSSNVGEEMTLCYSGNGETVAEALRLIINKTGNVPTYTHNKVIILSEDVAKSDITKVLDIFERDYTTQPITLVCIAKDVKAGDVLKANIGKDISKSEVLEKILNQSAISSITPETRLIDVINTVLDETACIALPTVTLQKNGETKTFFVENIAVFNYNNEISYYLGRESSENFVKLLGELKNGTLVTEDEKGAKATFIIVDGKTRYKAEVNNGIVNYNVKIKMYCDLNAYEGDRFQSIENETVDIFKKNIESDTERRLQNTYKAIQENNSFDILHFGRRLLQNDKNSYNQMKNDWQNNFKKSNINVNVEVVIRRIGEESYHE
ncbi:MAG: Ger(x)C family spore germination protein [Clostridia bacterium]|nr:Ger(x)C family spore germination protein [Clostridia bacterium]MBR3808801.1 Ger(x)C family spore germination protein [Clostridia bacterium]